MSSAPPTRAPTPSICERLAPDVLVVDFRMPPGIDGIETARRVRRRAPGVRVIVYTNYAEPELLDAADRLGVTYLQKGDLAALRRAVEDG
jgi:DNA-binding NarL/FixJ family response regulator